MEKIPKGRDDFKKKKNSVRKTKQKMQNIFFKDFIF